MPEVLAQSSLVFAFYQVTLATMAEEKTKDAVLGLVWQHVLKG